MEHIRTRLKGILMVDNKYLYLITHKEGSWSNHGFKKRPIDNMREVSALISIVQ